MHRYAATGTEEEPVEGHQTPTCPPGATNEPPPRTPVTRVWMGWSSIIGNQWFLGHHCKGRICERPWKRIRFSEAMWPNICCHMRAGGDGRSSKEVATSWKQARRASDENTFLRDVSISIPRYWPRVDGWRSNFSRLTIIPRSLHNWRTRSWCCSRRVLDSATTSHSSR